MEFAGMQYLAVFVLGLLSAPHCFGMCGGIAGALLFGSSPQTAQSSPDRSVVSVVQVNAAATRTVPAATSFQEHALSRACYFGGGKMLGYALLGVIAGSIGFAFGSIGSAAVVLLRSFAGLLMIAMGLYSAGWWLGLHRLETVAYRFWQPALRMLSSVNAGSGANKVMVGVVWGLLPCGLVYSVLGLALASGSSVSGLLIMLSFGLGTLPFVLATGGVAHLVLNGFNRNILSNTRLKKIIGTMLIIFGVVTVTMALMHGVATISIGAGHH
jgi:sulfite exporter TauE/SafE